MEVSEASLDIHTAQLGVRAHLGDFRLEWFDSEGQRFAADLPRRAYVYDRDGYAMFHYLERHEAEHYYGFGEKAGTLDKRGMRLRMHNVDALGYNAETSDPLYKHVPFYITYNADLDVAYGLLYDNLATTVFDLGKEIDAFWGYYRYWMAEGGDLDYTLIFGPSIEAVVEKYTWLTGRPALPPRWSLGYLASTMRYTEAPDAQVQLKRFVELCDQYDIPCDMFHLSSGYTTDETGRRFVFTWNRSKIPDPDAMTAHFHDAGMQLAANIKPYLLRDHPQYAVLAEARGFIRSTDDESPALSRFWSGGAFEAGDGAYVDFSSPAGYSWWKRGVTEQLLHFGIDAVWNDNNEFQIWEDGARCTGFGETIPIGLARPLQTLLMARASYDALREYAPEQRPFVLTRAGTVGIGRYTQTWSGDNATSWHTLRYNIPMGLGMSLSGLPNTGHDVGGFFGPLPDPELFVRWVQNGIFHPRFAIHSWKEAALVNEPWMHEAVLPIIQETMQFRYRLLPYLYTLLFEAHQTGHPIIRPLVYHFAHDPRCRTESFDFLLGSHLLVASVLEPGARTRRVYLPAGSWWCNFYTDDWYEGGTEIEVDAPLERIPLFVCDGGVIPMGRTMRHVGAQSDDVREVYVFARDEAAFTLIEDDGVSLDYERGGYTSVRLSLQRTNEAWVASATRLHAGYPLPYQEITFVVRTADEHPVQGGDRDEQGRWRVKVLIT